jgi:transcriptional regulator with XRE-family HTH domain
MTNRSKPTFGQALIALRRERGMNQKSLAESIRREDGSTISASYLNDIEHDRRSPTNDHLIGEMARALGVDEGFLTFIAGQLPKEIRHLPLDQERLKRAIKAFRREAETT